MNEIGISTYDQFKEVGSIEGVGGVVSLFGFTL